MPDCLNARMAAALAPVLGEEAVYHDAWVCRSGHLSMRWEYLCVCGEPGSLETHLPVDFADPAVGWGLWERWLSDSLSDVSITALSDGFDVEIIVDEGSGYDFYRRHDASLWGAVLAAWARAMGVGEVSGDA